MKTYKFFMPLKKNVIDDVSYITNSPVRLEVFKNNPVHLSNKIHVLFYISRSTSARYQYPTFVAVFPPF